MTWTIDTIVARQTASDGLMVALKAWIAWLIDRPQYLLPFLTFVIYVVVVLYLRAYLSVFEARPEWFAPSLITLLMFSLPAILWSSAALYVFALLSYRPDAPTTVWWIGYGVWSLLATVIIALGFVAETALNPWVLWPTIAADTAILGAWLAVPWGQRWIALAHLRRARLTTRAERLRESAGLQVRSAEARKLRAAAARVDQKMAIWAPKWATAIGPASDGWTSAVFVVGLLALFSSMIYQLARFQAVSDAGIITVSDAFFRPTERIIFTDGQTALRLINDPSGDTRAVTLIVGAKDLRLDLVAGGRRRELFDEYSRELGRCRGRLNAISDSMAYRLDPLETQTRQVMAIIRLKAIERYCRTGQFPSGKSGETEAWERTDPWGQKYAWSIDPANPLEMTITSAGPDHVISTLDDIAEQRPR